jgi:hypothetical protein
MRVEFDQHRWYVIVRVTHEDNPEWDYVKVIGNYDGSGLSVFDSIEEWEAATS